MVNIKSQTSLENFRVPKDLGKKSILGHFIQRLQTPKAKVDSAKQNSAFDPWVLILT